MLVKRAHTHNNDEELLAIFEFSPVVDFRSSPDLGFRLLLWSILYIQNTISFDEELRLFFLFRSWIIFLADNTEVINEDEFKLIHHLNPLFQLILHMHTYFGGEEDDF